MKILVKILLTFLMIIIGIFLFGLLAAAGGANIGVIRLFPAAIMIVGIIAIWRHKSKKQDNNDLDKTL